jgi:multiple sugar transport system permease protein
MTAVAGNRRRMLARITGYGFVLPYLVLFLGFVIAPLVFGLTLSLMQWEMLSPLPPAFVGLGNFGEALGDEYFWRALRATFLFVIMAVPLTVALAMLISLALAGLRRRQGLYRAAFILPLMINISVAGILWRWFFHNDFGVFNAYLGRIGIRIPWIIDAAWAMPSVVLMTLWWTVGGPAIILLAGLQQIPRHYYEAAEIDGAGAWHRFWHITLPLLRPVLLFVVVMNIIGSFQVFGQTFMITRGGPEASTRVLVQYVYETAFNHYRMGYGAAMSWLLFVIIAVFAIAQFRTMRER